MRLRGAQFDHEAPGSLRQVEQHQGVVAPLAVETVLPFKLAHRPRSKASVALFAGELPDGAAELQRQGVDWDVDIETREIRWLATARKALSTTSVVIVRYWRRREFDVTLAANGIA